MNNKGINSKQAMILVTLMVGILCVGVLAHNVNKNYSSDGDFALAMKEAGKQNEEKKSDDSKTSADYFYETRSIREQGDQKEVETLKAIIADDNTSKDQKENATEKLTSKTNNRNLENRIELNVKSKGYKDVICFLDDDKARVIISQNDKLKEEQTLEIQDIVKDVAKVYDIQIEAK